jgi:hypothetical protein
MQCRHGDAAIQPPIRHRPALLDNQVAKTPGAPKEQGKQRGNCPPMMQISKRHVGIGVTCA